MESSAFIARSCFIDYFCFFIIFFAGFFSPIFIGIIFLFLPSDFYLTVGTFAPSGARIPGLHTC